MPQLCFRLGMTAPLRVGEAGVGLEETLTYIPSDTIFSALAITWLEMGQLDPKDGLAVAFEDEPALLLTSAMPYVGDVRFFPKPATAHAPGGWDADGRDRRKGFKRVQWVSEDILHLLFAASDEKSLNTLWDSGARVQHGTVWLTGSEDSRIDAHLAIQLDGARLVWSEQKRPQVALDRISSASNLYHVGDVRFARNAGLWFAAEGSDDWLNRARSALSLLSDTGIGARRSRGYGQFELQSAPDNWRSLTRRGGNVQMMLSRCAPQASQMRHLRTENSHYQLVTVGGFHGTPGAPPFVRAGVRMLTEGSIVGQSQAALGQLVDVTPQSYLRDRLKHKVYRYGYGFGLAFSSQSADPDGIAAVKEARL